MVIGLGQGRSAFKLSIGQPQKGIFIKKAAFSAYTPPMFKAQGACHVLCKICDADFLKEIPTALQSADNSFQRAKLLQKEKKEEDTDK